MSSKNNQMFEFTDAKEQGVCEDNISSPLQPDDSISPPWELLIVDDDEEVHSLTRVVLKEYVFESRKLNISSAYTGAQAIEMLRQENTIAIVLLDVVMEEDDAGLVCTKVIRDKLKNKLVRIILRTGQPGFAPEQEVIMNYDINGYKHKTELTSQDLFTTITAALRTHKHIETIEKSSESLEKIIDASRYIFEIDSFESFADGVLYKIEALLQRESHGLFMMFPAVGSLRETCIDDYHILAATGKYANEDNLVLNERVCETTKRCIEQVSQAHSCILNECDYTMFCQTTRGEKCIMHLQWQGKLSVLEQKIISIFSANINVAFEKISLNNELKVTQGEMVFTLSELVEGRSKETASHIRRVALVSAMLARKKGLSAQSVAMIELSAPMHDIGKMGTPDYILKKPGRLTEEEYSIMKEHTEYGAAIFGNSNRELMLASSIIAEQHHEKWDGGGYPKGLSGENIHIYGRIVALADVVDALANKRCYKDAWSMDRVIEELKKQRGKHFDPELVDIFLDSLDEYEELLEEHPI